MKRHDVIIVGGGPAGSTLARDLGRRGYDVAVVDRHTFPRDKICAGWVTPAAVEALELNLSDYDDGQRALQPVYGFAVSRLGGPELPTRYEAPISYGIRRCEFDHYLLERAEATLYLGHKVADIKRDEGQWVLDGELTAPLLVGAGGHYCPIARHLGATLGDEPIVAAKEVEFEMDEVLERACPVEPTLPELYFFDDMQGYAWVVRKGNYLNVGLGRIGGAGLSEWQRRVSEFLARTGKVPARCTKKLKGHAYLLYSTSPRRLVDEGALLVGDAAGLADDMSGEGIRTAIESSLLAASVIDAAEGDYRASRLSPYPRRLEARFGERGPRGVARLSKKLPGWLSSAAARKLLEAPWFARHVIINRWFLHTERPALEVA